MYKENLIYNKDLELIKTHVSRKTRGGVEEIHVLDGIMAFAYPQNEINTYKQEIRDYYNYLFGLVSDVKRATRVNEYTAIAFPILMGANAGAYRPLAPGIRYSFYAREQLRR